MSSRATTVADYLAELRDDRRAEIERVRDLINEVLRDELASTAPEQFVALCEKVKPPKG